MDFRTVDASGVQWSIGARGQPAARLAAGAKVQVQTPTCACRVSVAGAGMYRVDMCLRPDVAMHRAFRQWIADVEDSAAEASKLATWRRDRRRSQCVYNDSVRLMAFSDTLAFDADGHLSADLMDARGCAVLLELQGLWGTDAKWGVRWRVAQIKFSKDAPDLPVEPMELDDTSPPAAAVPFAFLEE